MCKLSKWETNETTDRKLSEKDKMWYWYESLKWLIDPSSRKHVKAQIQYSAEQVG